VLRPALILLTAIVGLAVVLTLRPVPIPPAPNKGVVLEDVKLDLYPEQDPEATWKFEAGRVEQDPGNREAKVSGLKGGERYVGGKLDLRIRAPSVIIDRTDNLRLPYAQAEILKGCVRVELGSQGGPEVLIDQKAGFSAPSVKIEAPTYNATGTRFSSNFAIENVRWSDPKWQFYDYPEGESPPCTIEGGYE